MRFLLAFLFAMTLGFADQIDDFDSEFSDKNEISDPISGYNKIMTNVNDVVYEYAFEPVIKGYKHVVPTPYRTAFYNIFDNLMYPIRLVNNLLQFKFKNAGEETLRFVANTIVGFAGVSDVASKHYGLEKHDEDFGQTLGHWGFGSGFHIVWPILGPSNFRDTIGGVADYFTNPLSYVKPSELGMGLNAFSMLNDYSLEIPYSEFKKDAIELYPFLRDAYEQRRDYLIKE
ncbi:MlaA family lipoprotein [Campylobacter majalis]|uniref:MlaA family lipoprotein n=1 Tax=Campylobacter majalis TaxID=2790656 RepID=UPI003D698060